MPFTISGIRSHSVGMGKMGFEKLFSADVAFGGRVLAAGDERGEYGEKEDE